MGKNPLHAEDFCPFTPPVELYPWAVLVGEPREKPAMIDIYRQTLADAANDLQTAKTRVPGTDGQPVVSDKPYEALAEMLRNDMLFPAGELEKLASQHRFVHTFLSELGERRLCGAEFLRMAAAHLSTGTLLATAELFQHIATDAFNLQHIWGAPEECEKIVDPEVRARIAKQLQQIAGQERQAVDLLSDMNEN